MGKLSVFNLVSLDGYFTDAHGDMSFAHTVPGDAEWDSFVSGNARGGGILLFGRITYEMMAGFWPTQFAKESMPDVAERMNNLPKIVFSRSMKRAEWNNTTLVNDDLITAVTKLKEESSLGLAILGSGSIVSQLAQKGLIDELQLAVVPVALGKGRTLFEGAEGKLPFTHTQTRVFKNGNVLLTYTPVR